MSGFFFDADSSRRVARMVQAVERQRGDASGDPRRRVGFPQVLPMVCVSQPNIEAIAASGVWPETILATPLSERFGYRLEDLSGACLPPADEDGGGSGCDFPCYRETISITALTSGPEWTAGDVLTFGYVSGDAVAGQQWTVYYAGIDAKSALFTLTAYGLRDFGGCQFELSYKATAGTTNDPYLYRGPLSCAQFSLEDQQQFRRCWLGRVGPVDTDDDPADEEPDTPVDDVLTNEAATGRVYRVKPGVYGHGVPLRGQIFCAYYYGGALYHVGMRNSFLSGFGTGDTNPYTITVETCGNRVPFSWPQVDYGAKEGARLVIGWNQSNRRYEPVGVSC